MRGKLAKRIRKVTGYKHPEADQYTLKYHYNGNQTLLLKENSKRYVYKVTKTALLLHKRGYLNLTGELK
jgi:hypothetical protein